MPSASVATVLPSPLTSQIRSSQNTPTFPNAAARTWRAGDALAALQAAVGLCNVRCPKYVCDVDASGAITASDAFRILQKSVQLPVELVCGDISSVRLFLSAGEQLGGLSIRLETARAAGSLNGVGASVQCRALAPKLSLSEFNRTGAAEVEMGFTWLSGFQGSTCLAECDFAPGGAVRTEDFDILILGADDLSNQPVTVSPTIAVEPY